MSVAVGISAVSNPVLNLFAFDNGPHLIGYLLFITGYKKDILNVMSRALPRANVDHRQAEKRSLQQAKAGVTQQHRRAAQQVDEGRVGNVLKEVKLRMRAIFLNSVDDQPAAGIGIRIAHESLH